MQHYTRNTVSAMEWCKHCRKSTMHRVDGVKLGPCFECIARLEAEPKKPAAAKQSNLFTGRDQPA